MKKKKVFIRIATATILSLVMTMGLLGASFAIGYENEGSDGTPSPSRGNSPPSSSNTTTLPYVSSTTSYTYDVYSNFMFKPNSNGTININITGYTNTGTTVPTVELKCANLSGVTVDTKSFGTYNTTSSSTSKLYSGLNPSYYYYYYATKTNSAATLTCVFTCS